MVEISMAINSPNNDEFSTNRHAGAGRSLDKSLLSRHPDICFDDGNIAILTGDYYFLVHQGLLYRHSNVLEKLAKALDGVHLQVLEGRPVLHLQDSPEDMSRFLLALYDGISRLAYDLNNFPVVSGLLRLFTAYQVHALRADLLRGFSAFWPSALPQWELREAAATNSVGMYDPRAVLPHPILIINLARDIHAPELLPSAFYDLSRSPPSDCVAGYKQDSGVHQLVPDDLLNLLKGREHASRFLSTFIVNELEGREPSQSCLHQKADDPIHRRTCQVAFEAITFEILRDVNGALCKRSSDPLYAILDAELMQTKEDALAENQVLYRACEYCRSDFGTVVDAAREHCWQMLPQWFGVEVSNWG